MLFKKLEMHGFKSFAEPITVEFNSGITGIIGPNGSGKSNISDAIRWVLGEQSPKMLRGGKMEEVIFNGTSTRKSRGMAEVTLTIDNNDESLPIDYKEVAITRRMFRSGESEYRINGNHCRLRDIRELIMDTGIGVDGYSLIGQGKISDIINNKTESRRLIFEEAAGIVAYKSKKADAERKLLSTNLNMERLQDVIGEIESRIDRLREDSIKAKEFLELRERHKTLEINIVLKNIENIELKNEYTKDDLMEITARLQSLDEQKKCIDDRLSEGNARNEHLENTLVKARESLIVAIDELNAAINKEELDKERISTINKNKERIATEISELNDKMNNEIMNRDIFIKNRDEFDKEAQDAELKLKQKISNQNELSSEMRNLSSEIDKSKEMLFKASSVINSSEAEINSLKLLQETLIKRKDVLNEDKALSESYSKEALEGLNAMKCEKKRIAERLEDERKMNQNRTIEYEKIKSEEHNISTDIENIRINIGKLTTRKKTIEEMESNYEGYNFAVKHIMKSGLAGIHGVVAELIEVSKEHAVAIETALGGALQNIVCEDDESAKKAITSLKNNRAGRMTFLPLSSIRVGKNRPNGVASERGFIGFGPECVKFDNMYSEIIEYLLGRVIIVDTMDNAVRISKKVRGMRIVTLDGEIINAGGAITGGKYKNRTANILDRRTEIHELADKIRSLNEREHQALDLLDIKKNQKDTLNDEIIKMQETLRGLEINHDKCEREIKLSEGSLVDMKSANDKINNELENIAKEQAKSDRLVNELNDKIKDAKITIKDSENLGESTLKEYEIKKAEFDALSEEIMQMRIEAANYRNKLEHAEAMSERIAASIEEKRLAVAERKRKLAELTDELQTVTSESNSIDGGISEKEKIKENAEVYIKDITEEKTSLMAELSELTKEKEEIDKKLEIFRNQKYELNLKKTKNETQLENYKEKLWEDFEVSYIQAIGFRSDEFNMQTAVKENKIIKNRIKELGEVNVGAIEEYETVNERYEFLTNERSDIQNAMDNLTGIIDDMDDTIRAKFKESFDKIVAEFQKQFNRLFAGGHAELILSNADNPLESDIDIVAQPPGKKLQNINLLSGGEKTLTAIALMFAVLDVKPTPFCILDEVEAALDDTNIDRFINCLRQFDSIQFVLVTHQKSTMEHADVLYGVTMPEKGVSKVLSLSLEDNLDEYSA